MVTPAYTAEVWRKTNRYCKLKKYQTKFREWILIVMEIRKNGRENYDFRVYRGEWQYDPDLERAVEIRKIAAIKRHLRAHGKLERNALCPCNSGLKYKKCCGKN